MISKTIGFRGTNLFSDTHPGVTSDHFRSARRSAARRVGCWAKASSRCPSATRTSVRSAPRALPSGLLLDLEILDPHFSRASIGFFNREFQGVGKCPMTWEYWTDIT